MTSRLYCGPCEYESIPRRAKKWCTDCEGGLCGDCEKNHKSIRVTRYHNIISVDDYRQIQDISVNLECEMHDEKLDRYCKRHDILVCFTCAFSNHKSCSSSDLITIEEAAKNVKESSVLSDIEGKISRTLQNLKHCITNLNIALKNVDRDEQNIKKTIEDTRMNLNKYLDKLQENLLLDLKTKHENCKSKYNEILNKLNQQQKEVENLREQSLKMKRFASNIHTFLGSCQLNKTIDEKSGMLEEGIKYHRINGMEVEIHDGLSSLMKEVTHFGEIKIFETMSSLPFKDPKIDHAQINGPLQNVSEVRLQLNRKIEIKRSAAISGCLMLSDDRIIIADEHGKGRLIEYNKYGKRIHDIAVSGKPYGLTAVDTDLIAVTYGESKYLEIINTKKNSERKKEQFSTNCWGISYQDQKLYIVVEKQGIVVLDLNGKTLNTIDIDVSKVFDISTTRDRIFYTDWGNNTVHCCSIAGHEIWIFRDESLSRPRGISVDNNQYIFVASFSNNLTVIQHDGKSSKVLPTEPNERHSPWAVHYNKEKKIVCLGYKHGSVALFNVIPSIVKMNNEP
ncbi:unnamed protein product [Mytilus coruscus]|uniref:B box-type domain-containing protein n=1 Tax=Mytilus coruscus TaxID=42192 RepID=A0A6J8ELK0_MYTCO|nr:unnamed protein product [Mytilus coruscus]